MSLPTPMRKVVPFVRALQVLVVLSVVALSACGEDGGGEIAPGPTPTTDARVTEDSGPQPDGANTGGTVPPADASVDNDVGPEADAGPGEDAGPGADSGPGQDAGPGGDAVVVPDGDVPDEGPPVVCDDPSGCWSCAPVEQTHFLNRCTSSDCAPFDNAARLPLFATPLPPLP